MRDSLDIFNSDLKIIDMNLKDNNTSYFIKYELENDKEYNVILNKNLFNEINNAIKNFKIWKNNEAVEGFNIKLLNSYLSFINYDDIFILDNMFNNNQNLIEKAISDFNINVNSYYKVNEIIRLVKYCKENNINLNNPSIDNVYNNINIAEDRLNTIKQHIDFQTKYIKRLIAAYNKSIRNRNFKEIDNPFVMYNCFINHNEEISSNIENMVNRMNNRFFFPEEVDNIQLLDYEDVLKYDAKMHNIDDVNSIFDNFDEEKSEVIENDVEEKSDILDDTNIINEEINKDKENIEDMFLNFSNKLGLSVSFINNKNNINIEKQNYNNYENREFVLEKVRKDGRLLKNAKNFQNDKQIVLEAIRSKGSALKYASDDLRNNKEFVLEALKIKGVCLKYASLELKKDKEFILNAIKNKSTVLKYANPSFKNDRDFILEAVKNNGLSLRYASKYQNDEEVVKTAYNQNKNSLKYASLEIQSKIAGKSNSYKDIDFGYKSINNENDNEIVKHEEKIISSNNSNYYKEEFDKLLEKDKQEAPITNNKTSGYYTEEFNKLLNKNNSDPKQNKDKDKEIEELLKAKNDLLNYRYTKYEEYNYKDNYYKKR